MQEQTNLFLASPDTLRAMPYLYKLFGAIDELITECVKVNSADLTQLKRFVAGHVANDDLNEFDGRYITIAEEKKIIPTDWNALMGIAMVQKKRPRIDAKTHACARQLLQELNSDEQDRTEELRAKVEAKKKKS